jgi:hypothetical protein
MLSFTVLRAYGIEETKFIPKNYTGSKFKEKGYKPKSYSSTKTADVKKYQSSTKNRSFWSIFKRKEISEPKVLSNTKSSDDKMFSGQEQSTQPLKRPDEKELTDNVFESHADEIEKKEFIPDNRPRARDPLLAPRQGVKAPKK